MNIQDVFDYLNIRELFGDGMRDVDEAVAERFDVSLDEARQIVDEWTETESQQ